ncbi:MAG: NDP-sugar synthase [Caldilineaceae bacterium]|nr:NDP-sugar synthase [Caldilineaceae bacterium]
MQAILIATDEGKNLYPLTATMPSSLLPIAERPIIVYAIELLARASICDIFIAVDDPTGMLAATLGQGERWNVQLHYHLPAALDETCLVLPADALLDLAIEDALAYHQSHGRPVTAIRGRQQWRNAEIRETGAFLVEPTWLNTLLKPVAAAERAQLLASLHQSHTPAADYVMTGYWNALRDFGDFQAAQQTVLASLHPMGAAAPSSLLRYPYVEAGEVQPGIWVAPHCIIHPTAQLTAPLLIGTGCRIGPHVEVGPGTVLGAGVVLDEGVTIQASTVLPNTYVGQFLHLAQRVAYHAELIDIETGTNVQIADPWLLAQVNPTLASDLAQTISQKVQTLVLGLLKPLLALIGFVMGLVLPKRDLGHFGQQGATPTPLQTNSVYEFKAPPATATALNANQRLELAELYRRPE